MIYIFIVIHLKYILIAWYRLVSYIIMSVTSSEIFQPEREGSHDLVAYNPCRPDSHCVQKYSVYVIVTAYSHWMCSNAKQKCRKYNPHSTLSFFFYRLQICGACKMLLQQGSKKAKKSRETFTSATL